MLPFECLIFSTFNRPTKLLNHTVTVTFLEIYQTFVNTAAMQINYSSNSCTTTTHNSTQFPVFHHILWKLDAALLVNGFLKKSDKTTYLYHCHHHQHHHRRRHCRHPPAHHLQSHPTSLDEQLRYSQQSLAEWHLNSMQSTCTNG